MAKEQLYYRQAQTKDQIFQQVYERVTQTDESQALTAESLSTYFDSLAHSVDAKAATATSLLSKEFTSLLTKHADTVSHLDDKQKIQLEAIVTNKMQESASIVRSQNAKWASLFSSGLTYDYFDLETGKADEVMVRNKYGKQEKLIQFILGRTLSTDAMKREMKKRKEDEQTVFEANRVQKEKRKKVTRRVSATETITHSIIPVAGVIQVQAENDVLPEVNTRLHSENKQLAEVRASLSSLGNTTHVTDENKTAHTAPSEEDLWSQDGQFGEVYSMNQAALAPMHETPVRNTMLVADHKAELVIGEKVGTEKNPPKQHIIRKDRKADFSLAATLAPVVLSAIWGIGQITHQEWAYDLLGKEGDFENAAKHTLVTGKEAVRDLLAENGIVVSSQETKGQLIEKAVEVQKLSTPEPRSLVLQDNPPPEISFVPVPVGESRTELSEVAPASHVLLDMSKQEVPTQTVTPPVPTLPSTGGGGMAEKKTLLQRARSFFQSDK
jgi:hypothetical protein